jgi:amino-acid N-acetyltransferase
MITRDATEQDWNAISALLQREGLPLAGAREHLAHFIVAEDDEGVAGAGGLEVYGPSALLRSLVAAHHGRGIGHLLVEQLIVRARALGVTDLVLLTTTAAGYFPRFGFETVARPDVPAALLASREFQGACPSSATVMRLRLVTHD